MSKNLVKDHWTREAVCGLDTKILTNVPEEIDAVKRMCKSCPVQAECIKWTEELDGSWISAGTTKYERLMLQWKRVEKENESNFRGSEVYLREVLRRIR